MSSNTHEEEKELVLACVAGDQGAWSTFMHRYATTLCVTARTVRVRKRAWTCDEDDLVGHAVEKLLEDRCRRLACWRGDARLSTYLVQVVRNLCLDYIAVHSKHERVPDAMREPQEWVDTIGSHEQAELDEERRAAVQAAMEQLSPKQAMIIRLRMDGNSLRQIARTLRLPPGSVAVENSRAVEKLRRALVGAVAPATSTEAAPAAERQKAGDPL